MGQFNPSGAYRVLRLHLHSSLLSYIHLSESHATHVDAKLGSFYRARLRGYWSSQRNHNLVCNFTAQNEARLNQAMIRKSPPLKAAAGIRQQRVGSGR
jgi:hypothetical protein